MNESDRDLIMLVAVCDLMGKQITLQDALDAMEIAEGKVKTYRAGQLLAESALSRREEHTG